jgi:hypothetical protein
VIWTEATWLRFQIGSNVAFREPQVQDLGQPHLAQEVVDAVQLRLVEVLVDLLIQLARRRQVVPERLLDDDAGVPASLDATESESTTGV